MRKKLIYIFTITCVILLVLILFIDKELNFQATKLENFNIEAYQLDTCSKINDNVYIKTDKGKIIEIFIRTEMKPGSSFAVKKSRLNSQDNMSISYIEPKGQDFDWFRIRVLKGRINTLTINNKEIKL